MAAVETQDYSTRNTDTLDCRMLPIEQLRPGANPRHNLDLEGERFRELVRSIQERGIRQPLLVRPSACLAPGPPFEIVAGERRYRAALALHLDQVPVRVVVQDDEASLLDALIENLMREDIDPIDEARGYKSLMDMGLKQTEIAVKVGRSQPAIANTLRLLKLPEPVQDDISAGRMTQSHGEALIPFAQYPDVLEVQREAALGGQTCKAVAEPNYWKLCHEGSVRNLDSEWPECKNCNHKRKESNHYRYCLKPECFDEKEAAADAKLLEKAKTSAGVDDASKLLKLADMKYGTYERLDISVPPGCSQDCEKRVVALNHELRPVPVCLDPSHHRKLKLAESKAVRKSQRETAAGVTIQIQELLCGHNMQEPTPFRSVLDRAAALLTLRVIQGTHKGVVKSVMERMRAKGLGLDAEYFKPSQVCAPPDAEELTKLEQFGYLNLLLFGAELVLAERVQQSLEYGGSSWNVPEQAEWFLRDLRDIGHMDPEEIGDQMQAAADEQPESEPESNDDAEGRFSASLGIGDFIEARSDGHQYEVVEVNLAVGTVTFKDTDPDSVDTTDALTFDEIDDQFYLAELCEGPDREATVTFAEDALKQARRRLMRTATLIEEPAVAKVPDYVWLGTKGDESRFVDHVRQAGSLVIISDRETGAEFSAEKSELKRYGGHGFTLAEEKQQAVEDPDREVDLIEEPGVSTCGSCGNWDEGSEEDRHTGECVLDDGNDRLSADDKACREWIPQAVDVPTCHICGCDDDHACEGGCHWVEPDLCSQCADITAAEQAEEDRPTEPEDVKPINYRDGAGSVYFVSQGLGGLLANWMTLKRQPGTKQHTRGSHRVKSKNLPAQPTQALAQLDLNAYAEKHGLTVQGAEQG